MKVIAGYISDYFRQIDLRQFTLTTLVVAALIFFNYHFGLDHSIIRRSSWEARWLAYFLLFGLTFWSMWAIGNVYPNIGYGRYWLILVIAPAIFALKTTIRIEYLVTVADSFTRVVLQWPLKAFCVATAVVSLWRVVVREKPVAGVSANNLRVLPYLLIVLFAALPIAWAGSGEAFQRVYPKLQMVGASPPWWKTILFELSYGLDFFTIELFFRGFLVLALVRVAGPRAILPIAAFYCTIHFGKPLAECISSYAGAIILSVLVTRTKTIWGGLIVHLGVAWMMEFIGFLYR